MLIIIVCDECGCCFRKDMQAAQREYKRKKNEKKRLRVKELEEQKEKEKNKWLNFNSKVRLWLQLFVLHLYPTPPSATPVCSYKVYLYDAVFENTCSLYLITNYKI